MSNPLTFKQPHQQRALRDVAALAENALNDSHRRKPAIAAHIEALKVAVEEERNIKLSEREESVSCPGCSFKSFTAAPMIVHLQRNPDHLQEDQE